MSTVTSDRGHVTRSCRELRISLFMPTREIPRITGVWWDHTDLDHTVINATTWGEALEQLEAWRARRAQSAC